MAVLVVCDFGECTDPATIHIEVLDGEFAEVEFDACTFGHAEAYYDSLYTLPLDEDEAVAP